MRFGLRLLFLILLGRFFYLQVLSGSMYRQRSEQNCIRRNTIPAARGLILDRNGRVLAENRPSYSLFVIPYLFLKNDADAMVASSLLGMSVESIHERIDSVGAGPFTPVRLKRDAPFDLITAVEENRLDLPALAFEIEPVRSYPADLLAHVLGYPGEAGPGEIGGKGPAFIERGDLIGKTGVEKTCDAILRGRNGYRTFEVDVSGRVTGRFIERDLEAVPGRAVTLTIDSDLQILAESELAPYRGALIVLDPKNGEILAMASKPDFTLNTFATVISSRAWKNLTADEGKPLLHRALQAQLPPGSTYKLITALAALETNSDEAETIMCPGYYQIGQRVFNCWLPEGHGLVNLTDALKMSCNVYFYQRGLAAGIDALASAGRRMGIGSAVSMDLPGPAAGLLPDRHFLNIKYGKNGWTRGMVANLAVGQGDLLVTPLQMARVVTLIANSGECPAFHVLKSVEGDGGTGYGGDPFVFRGEKQWFAVIQRGMAMAVQEAGGTARAAWVKGFEVCGKTGTAQNPKGEPHAWFAGFAPARHPRVVVVVMLENAGSGGSVAAPVAGRIFKWLQIRYGLS